MRLKNSKKQTEDKMLKSAFDFSDPNRVQFKMLQHMYDYFYVLSRITHYHQIMDKETLFRRTVEFPLKHQPTIFVIPKFNNYVYL